MIAISPADVHSLKGAADKSELVSLLSDLIAIESVNPLIPHGGSGEAEVIRYIAGYFERLKVPFRLEEVFPGRNNLIALLEGETRHGICFESHTDTVSAENMTIEPFNPLLRDGRLYGRGACDDKGSLACMMVAVKLLKQNNLRPATDMYFVAAIDEEDNYRGVAKLLENGLKVSAAVAGEPTGMNVGCACKGTLRFDMVAKGKAGHSSRPHEGRNAIVDMANVVAALQRELPRRFEANRHPLLGTATFSVGRIQGGTLVNIIPDECRIQIDRRTLPGDDFEIVREEMLAVVRTLQANDPALNVTVEPAWVTDYPMDTPTDATVVQTAAVACETILGHSNVYGVAFGCDASKFARIGVDAIVMGPGDIQKAHSADEFIPVDELAPASEVYAELALRYKPY